MTTQNVPLSDHGREYVAAVVESGEAKDAAEVVDFALRKMEADRRAHDAKVEAFREAVQTGLDDLENGRFTAVAAEDLPAFINGLSPRLSPRTPGQ
ncbi:type II toxin-antitoxin system ParD family antitoxin [Nocardioides sp.]|uniref:ribbon-helix-helix domain-containing protein n=1 Tax=Nocardioides sp. TaxID=35761 RepID=UPI0026312332|nr:type II toxin-antitoxin system ParD family antitoxin [Nocardioides sp.]